MKCLTCLLLLLFASGALFAAPIIYGTVPNGTVGAPYPGASLTVYPGAPLAAWSISVGSLPPGLSLSPTTVSSAAATISGTPTVAGTYNFTVQANLGLNPNAAPVLVTQAYTVVIAGAQVSPVSLSLLSLPNGVVGVSYSGSLTATGGYGPQTYTFTLIQGSPPPGLQLNPSSGVFYGIPTTAGPYPFTVQVTSQSGASPVLSASGTFSITITPPPLAITTSSLLAGTVGAAYSQALTATGGTPPYAWRTTGGSLPGGLTLVSSGNITGTPAVAGSFTFQVTVSDSQTPPASAPPASFTIRITPAALVIATTSLPAGTVGTSYTATTLAATGGTPPYTWSVASGALPSGLSISSTGFISGTPTAAGTFSVTVQVTDSAQATATKAYSVTVAAAAVPLSITTQAPLPSGVIGVAYTQTFAATGGTPPYTWSVSAGAAPTGLTLTAAGGLTGTPTAAGTYNFTLQVADSAAHTAIKAFSISVVAAVKITPATPPSGVTGVLYTQQFAAIGGVTPYVWSVASGSIPGLSLNSATGLLSGTPTTAGTYAFTIGVTDQNGQKDSASYTIAIVAPVAPLSITTQTPLPGGVVGVSYTQTFAATGGTSPYQWVVSAGALPTGLTLSATGSLTGTPTVAGTFNFTLRVGDAAGRNTTSPLFTITVTAALTITTATLPNGTVGTVYSQTLTAANGSGALTWSISTEALLAGITLSSAGSLSGTPSAPGTFTFTVSVAGGGQTATKSFTITVGVPPGPPVTITGLPATLTLATQPVLGIGIGNAYPLAITGQVTLAFAPDSGPDDPNVQFTTGGRTVSFQMAANTTQAVFTGATPGVQTGTVSGTVTLTVKLTAAGIDITPSPAPSLTLRAMGVPQPGPSATIKGLPATASPATQPALGISIPNAYPLPITGQVTLTFAPDSPSPDGGEVQFTTGGRTVSFTVPANTTQVVFSGGAPGVQIGTVSGTITLTLKLTAAGIDVTPSPAPSTTLLIAKSAPVITSATVTRTSGGFNLVVVGYATSREMVSANVGFTAAAGVTLASSQATVPLATVFTTWYQSTASAVYGSQFSLTMPFTFSSGTNPLTSVSVQLTNAQGNSNSMSATY